ncbi:MAG: hypothetical protein IJN86_04455 [Clostridia bacterium]|nr:hypothetical protein [Clostridia bacterium]
MSTKKIIRQIAKENGVTPEEVETEMREAIRIGMASVDPEVQKFWNRLAPDGKEPSIDAFLRFCCEEARYVAFGNEILK